MTFAAELQPRTRFEETVATARRIAEGVETRAVTRRRVRTLVERIDATIAACERAHLAHCHDVYDDLAVRAGGVVAEAYALGVDGIDLLDGAGLDGPLPTRVVDLMDRLWLLQENVFDVLAPNRRELLASDATLEDGTPVRITATEG